MVLVSDILIALNKICNGRCLMTYSDFAYGKNQYIVTKSSGIPGKAITELPGLIYGDTKMKVNKVAVIMTLTESAIELAAASGVNVIIAHHPVGDGCNSGGVTLKNYLSLYNIALFELHEAFHGLHPGVAWIHGYNITNSFFDYGGVQGNIAYIGKVFTGIKTLGDILKRLDILMDLKSETCSIPYKSAYDSYKNIYDSSSNIASKIILGKENSIVNNILHIFPHTGFNVDNLREIISKYPEVDTILVSISRVRKDSDLVKEARQLRLNLICGNSHSMEIYENGLPLAYALRRELNGIEIVIFRETMVSVPLDYVSTKAMREYGQAISRKYL